MLSGSNTLLIVKDKKSEHDTYRHVEHLDKFDSRGIIVKDLTGGFYPISYSEINMFEDGIIHQKNTISDVLHFAIQLEYETVVFCGVDLNDSRYFWLRRDETRELLRKGGKSCDEPHKQRRNVLALISAAKQAYPWVDFRVESPNSALAEILEVW